MDSKQLVYIVEDDISIRELEIYALKNANFDTRGLSDGKELQKAIEEKIPDIVLLDIMLPDEDGLSLLTKI